MVLHVTIPAFQSSFHCNGSNRIPRIAFVARPGPARSFRLCGGFFFAAAALDLALCALASEVEPEDACGDPLGGL